jgi:biopolymer transport protein ExbD
MRFHKRVRGGSLEVNMTPMIDVVFLLMIYFMTTLNAASVSKEELELPQLKGSQDQTETALTVNVSQSGEIFVVGESITLQQLIAMASDEIGRLDNDPARLNVVVRADRRGTSRTVNEVVSALVKLDVSRIQIGVQEAAP